MCEVYGLKNTTKYIIKKSLDTFILNYVNASPLDISLASINFFRSGIKVDWLLTLDPWRSFPLWSNDHLEMFSRIDTLLYQGRFLEFRDRYLWQKRVQYEFHHSIRLFGVVWESVSNECKQKIKSDELIGFKFYYTWTDT